MANRDRKIDRDGKQRWKDIKCTTMINRQEDRQNVRYTYIDRQLDRHLDRRFDRHLDRELDRQLDRRIDRIDHPGANREKILAEYSTQRILYFKPRILYQRIVRDNR